MRTAPKGRRLRSRLPRARSGGVPVRFPGPASTSGRRFAPRPLALLEFFQRLRRWYRFGLLHQPPEILFQLIDSLPGRAGERLNPGRFGSYQLGSRIVWPEEVSFGQDHDVLLLGQRWTVQSNFVAKPVVHRLGLLAIERDEQRDDTGTLDVLQETKTQSFPLVGSLDDARDVGHDECAMPRQGDHPQVGLQRGEGIVRNLGTRRRYHRQECALPRVGLS